ncbi:MAG: AraC family transcriptional regulator [Angelakisella sp.]
MDYKGIVLNEEIKIEELLTVHYFEYASDFFFPGEAHNFWEFLYVDKGEVEVTADTTVRLIKKGEIIFHKPMEFHNLWANGTIAPNLVVVAFSCNSPAMSYFEDKILRAGDRERNIMATLVQEAKAAFSSPLDDPNLRFMERRAKVPFGTEQFIKLHLELMLLQLALEGQAGSEKQKHLPSSSMRERSEQDVCNKVVAYLENNLYKRITLDDVCRDNIIGRSYLQKMFHDKSGCGVMEYFGKLKIEAAKQAIRQNSNNFTEISQQLGYSSIHYFSRHFKKVTGMTPSEYSSSVKLRSEIIRP